MLYPKEYRLYPRNPNFTEIDNNCKIIISYFVPLTQTTTQKLEAENKNLYEAMKNAAEHNAKLIAEYEEQIQVMIHLADVTGTFKLNYKMFAVITHLLFFYFHIRLTKQNWQINSKQANR